jgi:hypothetical protein
MDLRGSQLVVLSACDTGRGDVRSGRGVDGLRRAFLVAGADTLVTSLWHVDDTTTEDLMIRFYGRLVRGRFGSDALRHASLSIKARRPHPFYWAPFILIGQHRAVEGIGDEPLAVPVPSPTPTETARSAGSSLIRLAEPAGMEGMPQAHTLMEVGDRTVIWESVTGGRQRPVWRTKEAMFNVWIRAPDGGVPRGGATELVAAHDSRPFPVATLDIDPDAGGSADVLRLDDSRVLVRVFRYPRRGAAGHAWVYELRWNRAAGRISRERLWHGSWTELRKAPPWVHAR